MNRPTTGASRSAPSTSTSNRSHRRQAPSAATPPSTASSPGTWAAGARVIDPGALDRRELDDLTCGRWSTTTPTAARPHESGTLRLSRTRRGLRVRGRAARQPVGATSARRRARRPRRRLVRFVVGDEHWDGDVRARHASSRAARRDDRDRAGLPGRSRSSYRTRPGEGQETPWPRSGRQDATSIEHRGPQSADGRPAGRGPRHRHQRAAARARRRVPRRRLPRRDRDDRLRRRSRTAPSPGPAASTTSTSASAHGRRARRRPALRVAGVPARQRRRRRHQRGRVHADRPDARDRRERGPRDRRRDRQARDRARR